MKKTYLLLLAILINLNVYSQDITLDDIKKRVSLMEDKFSIKFKISMMPGITWDIDYEFAQTEDYNNLYSYLILFDEEFSKYPLSFLKKSELYAVVFVKSILFNNGNSDELRTSINDTEKEIMIFNFIIGNYDNRYQRHKIHHEFHHMLHEQFNGEKFKNDPVWNSFNENNYVYATEETFSNKEPSSTLINHPLKGFINSYSMSDFQEDKAEIFASLFTQEDYELLKIWVQKDEVLQNKVDYLKNFLKGIDRSFTKDYWEKLHN